MFSCTRKHLHAEIWTIPSVNNSAKTGCFICLLNQLSGTSVTSVQKQIALQIILKIFNDEDGPIWSACCQNLPIGHQIIDTISGRELQADQPLQDIIVAVCTLTVDKLLHQDGYKHLLTKFIEGIHTVNETYIQFCMNVISSLMSLSPVYVECLLVSYDEVIPSILEKAEFMEEKMVVSLIQMLIPVVKHINCLTNGDGCNGTVLALLIPLINSWLNTSQSIDLKINTMVLLKELSQHRAPVLSLLSNGDLGCDEDNYITDSSTPPDCPFLMGLKRMMTCKESELTFHCVQCLTQVLQTVQEPRHIRRFMASDLPEFVFESLHTLDSRQLEASFSCLDVMVNGDEFFQRCHAVYGIDATINAVKETLNSQRLPIAISGLHLLWCLLKRQPESMPLLLNNSWESCYQLICQVLQKENYSILMSGLQVSASFLRPQHQQSPVDIQSILSLICMMESKLQNILNRQDLLLTNTTSNSDIEVQTLLLNSVMDILMHVISLFQLDVIFQGNDVRKVCELKHVLQSVATDLIVSKKLFTHLTRSPDTADKYIKCVEATIFIQEFTPSDTEAGSQSAISTVTALQEFFPFLLKSGLPWSILRIGSTRCPSLQEQTAKLISHILSNCLDPLPPALQINPELFYLGLIQLQGTEVELSLKYIPTDKNAVLTEVVMFYLSWLHSYRPWPLDQLVCFLCEVFQEFPSYLSWHPIMLRSTIYFLALSEDIFQAIDTNPTLQYGEDKDAVVGELEKTSLDLWYTDCSEILSWTLSKHTRHTAVGTKTVEYWIHQLTLTDKMNEAMKTTALYLKDCLPFYQSIIDLLSSNTAGKMATQVLTQVLHDEPATSSKEMIMHWSYNKLEQAYSLTPDIDATTFDNILSVLGILIDGAALESNTSYLHSIKTVCQCAKYLTLQESESNQMVTALKYLSALVKKLTAQESNIVIPPLVQTTKITMMLQSAFSKCTATTLSHVLKLCAWLSTHAKDYEAQRPLIITSTQILSWLASCGPIDACSILTLVKSALGSMARIGNKTCGVVCFVKSHNTYFSVQDVFNEQEILQIYWHVMQYLVQDKLPEKQIAFHIMKTVMTVNPRIASQCVNNPWNSLLIENIFTTKADASINEDDLQLCTMISSSNGIWTPTSANSFLLALTTSDLESLNIIELQTILSNLKHKSHLYDPVLMSEVLKKLDVFT